MKRESLKLLVKYLRIGGWEQLEDSYLPSRDKRKSQERDRGSVSFWKKKVSAIISRAGWKTSGEQSLQTI